MGKVIGSCSDMTPTEDKVVWLQPAETQWHGRTEREQLEGLLLLSCLCLVALLLLSPAPWESCAGLYRVHLSASIMEGSPHRAEKGPRQRDNLMPFSY